MTAPGRPVSVWLDDEPGQGRSRRPALAGELKVDVAVLGGGIVGTSTALEAQRNGARVALLEARTIGAGVTGNTTAKLSALHGQTYDSIASTHGEATAAAYATLNQGGVARVRELVEELGIDCDLRTKANFTYTEDPSELESIEAEVEAAAAAGLPVTFTRETDLPFEIVGAVRCEDQAEFHPVEYLRGLVAAIEEGGGSVFEGTRAMGVSGGKVTTESGASVNADRVVVATHLPFLDRGLLFARASVQRSYAITVHSHGPVPQGMYLQAEKPGRSLRAIPWRGEELLMIGGQSHELAHGDAGESFAALERYARSRFRVMGIEHHWDAHDFMSEDGLPYIGRLYPGSDRVLVATGMRKWGLAMGVASGRILAERIAGRPDPLAEPFDPWRRPSLSSLPELAKHGAETGLHLVADRLRLGGSASELLPGEGRVIRDGLAQKAVHRDDAGKLHAVAARCTHLGCIVRWNAPERTWDCPCHGSRFLAGGEVATGPATAPLRRVDPPSE